ncbi:UDP-glucoronosyl and UDP-glucosyl transferase [Clostridium grantii DSM 8605]|uniref:UDP-glucoronosyl and UDP-glucosyl transferase n=2 Tax=Clostridium TaxID=1485 RepID=A0A1M5XV09_9CLOT|nr:UDP-glucoronosyl and UDP-glucosyl transferase [Clostridium grantii DSM 8605]
MSMMNNHHKIGGIVIEALKKSGKRGIISGFGKPNNLTNNIFAVDSIPHTWLFKHVAAVCHHGGAGTSAAGFSAGVPSIIIPFSNDQFAWAHRSYELGIGVKPLYMKDLNVDDLAERIALAYDPNLQKKAKEIGEKIQAEQGAKECANIIIDILP